MTSPCHVPQQDERTQLPPRDESPGRPAGHSGSSPTNAPRVGRPSACRDDAKRLATLVARAAMAGVTVHRIESDFGGEEFIATKWALTKSFSSMDALQAWMDRVSGAPGVKVADPQ